MHFFTATYDVAGVQGYLHLRRRLHARGNEPTWNAPSCDNSGGRRKGPLLFRIVMRTRVVV